MKITKITSSFQNNDKKLRHHIFGSDDAKCVPNDVIIHPGNEVGAGLA